jgi:hypothetical protein
MCAAGKFVSSTALDRQLYLEYCTAHAIIFCVARMVGQITWLRNGYFCASLPYCLLSLVSRQHLHGVFSLQKNTWLNRTVSGVCMVFLATRSLIVQMHQRSLHRRRFDRLQVDQRRDRLRLADHHLLLVNHLLLLVDRPLLLVGHRLLSVARLVLLMSAIHHVVPLTTNTYNREV